MPSPKLQTYFSEYANYHTTSGNRKTHHFGIPLIMLGLLGALSHISLGPITLGHMLLIGSILWYLSLDWRIGLAFAPVVIGIYYAGQTLELPWLWAAFIVGWILQGIGHYIYEKRSPAFGKNVLHLLVGPIWIFAKLTRLDRRR